ncbi:MAG: ribosome maturation factor RimP [Clostridia bacterium]|nr:ribosome maturation factor RimP [Clostridia bacterium]
MKKISIETYNKILPEISAVVEPVVSEFGAELVELSFSMSYGKLNLNLYVYKVGGVDLDTLETLHNSVSTALDTIEEKFEDDYIFNVSSPGLDRPITTDDDFRRAIGTEVEVKFEKPVDGRSKSHGILISFTPDEIEFEITQKQNKTRINYERKNIIKVQPFVKF